MEFNNKLIFEAIVLHITEACDHHCSFCYADTKKNRKSIEFENIKATINNLVEDSLIIKEMTLLGGDPAKHKDILKIAKYLYEKNINVSVLSNTHNYHINEINEIVKYVHSFETTIHSYIPHEHDEFCGVEGAFKNIIEKLIFFSKKNKSIGIALNITPSTYSKIYEIAKDLIKKYNINLKYIIFQRIIPMGRGQKTSHFAITREQVISALNQIKKINLKFDINIVIEDPVPLCILPDELQSYIHPCQWGLNKVSLNGYGDVSRCGADPRYRLGNIHHQKLSEIWKKSEILDSFRKKEYLPGRCQSCDLLDKCGGGCPLSCEIEKDHGIDYLYEQYELNDTKIHGDLRFIKVDKSELSSVLQIEWSNFAEYGHMFSVESIQKWFNHNSNMFWVVKDKRNWILGYAVIVPISKKLYKDICKGIYSSLIDFPTKEVFKNYTQYNANYYHIEVIATIYKSKLVRASSFLIKSIAKELLKRNAKSVTTSPVKDKGLELCKYFGFTHISDEKYYGETYPIYKLDVDINELEKRINRF